MATKVDIWMPLSIGDYLADTSHLSTLEHGAYLLMLMHYWRKGPLPNDPVKLANICKMTVDAWSIAQAVLKDFFSIGDDGLLHQRRADRERAKWIEKKDLAKEKAKMAAKARWGYASSNAPSIPQSNAQAMLNPCPLPLPLPIKEQVQIPSRAKNARATPEQETKTALRKKRHDEFKAIIAEYWDSKNKGVQMPWDGREGKHLEMFLRAAPDITAEQFRRFLRNRFKSEVNHGERASQWIAWVTNYAQGPMDRFGKPMSAHSNGKVAVQPKPKILRYPGDKGED
jgi:uncharacterized protein YdaU (DUF1376 family)